MSGLAGGVRPTQHARFSESHECALDLAHMIRVAMHLGDTESSRSLLLDAKTHIPSGEWHRWVEEWICITPRRAQQIMRESPL